MSYDYYSKPGSPGSNPLLVYLHGKGEIAGKTCSQVTTHGPWTTGERIENSKVLEDLKGFFRVGPHLPGEENPRGEKNFWDSCKLKELILELREKYQNDISDYTFVAGISRGGWGALNLVTSDNNDLNIRGMVICCPQKVDTLEKALDYTPIYLFHCKKDNVVELSEEREELYNRLEARPNFRWVNVSKKKTLYIDPCFYPHVCWTNVFGHPGFYEWFRNLIKIPGYGNDKNTWPDFNDLKD